MTNLLKIFYASKITRNFYNGIWSSFSLYYFLRCIDYVYPYWICFTLALSIFSGLLKSIIILAIKKYINKTFSFYLGILLELIPLILLRQCCYSQDKSNRANSTFMILLNIGFFSVNGQQFIYFRELDQQYLTIINNKKSKQFCKRLGYISQGLGAFTFLYCLTFHTKYDIFTQQFRIRQLFIIIYLIGLINISLNIIRHILQQNYYQSNQLTNQIHTTQRQKLKQYDNISISYKYILFSIINGISIGLISSSFITYFLDIKYNYYHNHTGIILFCFFILKGIGSQLIHKIKNHQNLLYKLNLISNLLLILITVLSNLQINIYNLLLTFPIYHYNTIKLKQNLSNIYNHKQISKIKYWQTLGISLGVLICSISYHTLYTNKLFSYPFLLCGLLRMINIHLFNNNSNNNNNSNHTNKLQIINQSIDQQSITLQQSTNNSPHHKIHKIHKIILIIIIIISLSQPILQYHKYQTHNFFSFHKIKKQSFTPNIKMYNQSIAHFLIKQNINNIQLIDCSSICQSLHQHKDQYYSQLNYVSNNPQWLHFPSMTYTPQDAINQINQITKQNQKLKGFSLSWNNPRYFNKISNKLTIPIIKFTSQYNFYYNQMPSLNLSPLQGSIIMIFTKQLYKLQSPSPLIKIPPKNYIGIQTTFKLLTNIIYLRQYLLYHINLGFDKFFLYNNDRNPQDIQLYKQNRNTGSFISQCLKISYSQSYSQFNSLWEEFYNHIIYIPWLINNSYAQPQSFMHYDIFYRAVTTFTAYTDIDQFIYTPTLKYIPDYLQQLLQQQYTSIFVYMWPFKSRLCGYQQLVIEQYQWNIKQPKYTWMIKDIIVNKLIGSLASVHGKYSINGQHCQNCSQIHDIKILHYKSTTKFDLYSPTIQFKIDQSMKIYVKQLKQSCKGKCSNQFKLTCSKQKYQQYMKQFCKQ